MSKLLRFEITAKCVFELDNFPKAFSRLENCLSTRRIFKLFWRVYTFLKQFSRTQKHLRNFFNAWKYCWQFCNNVRTFSTSSCKLKKFYTTCNVTFSQMLHFLALMSNFSISQVTRSLPDLCEDQVGDIESSVSNRPPKKPRSGCSCGSCFQPTPKARPPHNFHFLPRNYKLLLSSNDTHRPHARTRTLTQSNIHTVTSCDYGKATDKAALTTPP